MGKIRLSIRRVGTCGIYNVYHEGVFVGCLSTSLKGGLLKGERLQNFIKQNNL